MTETAVQNSYSDEARVAELESARAQDMMESEEAQEREAAAKQKKTEEEVPGWVAFLTVLLPSLFVDNLDLYTAGTLSLFLGIPLNIFILIVITGTKGWKKQTYLILGALVLESIPFIAAIPLRSVILLYLNLGKFGAIFNLIARVAKYFGPEGELVAVIAKGGAAATHVAEEAKSGHIVGAAKQLAHEVKDVKSIAPSKPTAGSIYKDVRATTKEFRAAGRHGTGATVSQAQTSGKKDENESQDKKPPEDNKPGNATPKAA